MYHALNTSTLHNTRLARVIRPGIYAGFRIRRNAADPSLVDLTFGDDGSSVLLTVEGVRVQEIDEIAGVVSIQPADSTFARYDLVVAEYQWSPDNGVGQTYRVIRGVYQRDLDAEPIRPKPVTEYQIPLAWIYVRPKTSLNGASRVEVLQSDIFPAPKAADTEAPYDISTLKPEVDVTNRKRLYVHRGVYPNSLGTTAIIFGGGYSTEVDDSAMVDGETKYFLYGISDDQEISVVGESSVLLTIPEIGADVLPLCVAKATKRGTTTTIDELVDIRFPFSRRMIPQGEDYFYWEYLRDSVFTELRTDTCDVDTLLDLDTLSPVETGLTAEMNRGDTSFTVTWTGSGEPSTDVTVATKNIIDGTDINTVRHILMLAESDIAGLQFDYSTLSSYSGFTGRWYDFGTIQEILGGQTSRLFIKFRIPKSQFTGGGSKKIFSYGVCMNLDYGMLNKNTLAGLGLEALGQQIDNLIPNGDFYTWSRNDSVGVTPDLASRNRVDYLIRASDFAARKNIFAADGWQFTKLVFDSENSLISRVLWSRDVLGLPDDNTIDTALEWKSSASAAPGQENQLEFRVPTCGRYLGQTVTFAVDYKTSALGAVGVELRFYERNGDGSFSIQSSVRTGIIRTDGTLLVKSEEALNERVFAVGFVIVFQQLNMPTSVWLKNARAALGRYETLPFRRPENADALCRAYYERGRVMATANLGASEDLGATVQFGSLKKASLSENGTLAVADLLSRAVNVGAVAFAVTPDGFAVTSRAIVDGPAIIDLDWEAAVVYPEA